MSESNRGDFEQFGFTPAFEITVNPEFPGSGSWSVPVYSYDRDGKVVDDFRSPWGTPLVVEVRPFGFERWVGFFPNGGIGGASGAFATPNPHQLCVCAAGSVHLVDVQHPETGTTFLEDSIQEVAASDEPAILLLADFAELVAVDAKGLAWKTQGLSLDGVRIVDVVNGVVRVGVRRTYEMTEEILDLDARTGFFTDSFSQ